MKYFKGRQSPAVPFLPAVQALPGNIVTRGPSTADTAVKGHTGYCEHYKHCGYSRHGKRDGHRHVHGGCGHGRRDGHRHAQGGQAKHNI